MTKLEIFLIVYCAFSFFYLAYALKNPDEKLKESFRVLPKLEQILVLIISLAISPVLLASSILTAIFKGFIR